MSKLFFAIHAVALTVLMGVGVIAVLTLNLPGWQPLVIAAAAGFLVSIPVAWVVARKLETLTG